jgi:hypothetical protein
MAMAERAVFQDGSAGEADSAPPEPWVELRIHGVSGTPPPDMLGSAHVVQVAGDARRRVFQRSDADGRPVPRDADGRVLEGYHWGALTAGSWLQGLWFMLIPFGFVNAAQFMLPAPPDTSSSRKTRSRRNAAVSSHVVSGSMLRVVGLAMTCVLALAASFIVANLAALRASHQAGVSDFWLHVLPSAGLLATALVIFALYAVGGRTKSFAYQRESNPRIDVDSPLATRDFFKGDPSVTDLRRLHLAGGLAVAGLPVAWTLANDAGHERFDLAVRTALIVVALTAGVLALLVGDLSHSQTVAIHRTWLLRVRDVVQKVTTWANWALLGGVLAALAGLACRLPFGLNVRRGAYQRYGDFGAMLCYVLLGGLGVLLLSTAILALTGRRPDRALKRYFGAFVLGFAAFFVSAIGVFLGLGFAGAFAYAAARSMAIDTNDSNFPGVLQRVAYAWGVTAIELVVIVLALLVNWALRAGWRLPWEPVGTRSTFRSRANLDLETADPRLSRLGADAETAAAWEKKVATAMWMARLKRRLPSVLVLMVVVGLVMMVSAAVEMPDDSHLPGLLDYLTEEQGGGGTGFMTWLGTTSLLALAGLLVSVGRGGVRAQSKRRSANVIWDVIAFWPHSTHPFAPPPYSQLCVLDFRDRIRYHLGTLERLEPAEPPPAHRRVPQTELVPGPLAPHGGRRVIVGAHSQGSLIAAAALLWLREEERERVGLVTHGSQLQVAFPRAFPAYVHVHLLESIMGNYQGRWVNLYRETDHIAGPVWSWRHWGSAKRDRACVRVETTSSHAEPFEPHRHRSCTPQTEAERRDDAVFPTGLRVCGHDWRLLDPAPFDPGADRGPVFQIRKHSSYPSDPHWKYAVNRVGGSHELEPYPRPYREPADRVDAALPD